MNEQEQPIEERQDVDVQPPAEPDNPPSAAQLSKDAIDKIIGNMRDKVLADMILSVENEKTRNYILSRVVKQMDYYSLKSRENKNKYTLCMQISIGLGAAIPVLAALIPTDSSGLFVLKLLIALCGVGITAANAYMNLHDFKELGTTYRSTREALLRTLYAYFNDAEDFAMKATQEERDALLINLCEDELARESESWRRNA